MEINKIFGIGLPRTGTSSLSKALRMLGFDVRHSDGRFQIYRYMTNPEKRHLPRYTLDFLDRDGFFGLTDTPANLVYKDLDQVYPNSKFILTVRRDVDEWHKSCAFHYSGNDASKRGDTLRFFRTQLWGCLFYDHDKFQKTYDRHDAAVIKYFRGRPDDLLVIDIIVGEQWDMICPFLSVEVPDLSFPWKHRRKS